MTTYYIAAGTLDYNGVHAFAAGDYVDGAHPGWAGWNAAGQLTTTTNPPPTPGGGPSGTRFALYSELAAKSPLLSGGSATPWLTGTSYLAGAIRSDGGYAWVDLLGGASNTAPSADVSGRWVRLGSISGKGSELAAAPIAITGTASLTTAFTDIAGFSVGPVIGPNGVYIDVIGSFGSVTVKTLLIQLYDVTAAAAVCQQPVVTVAGATGVPFVMRARLAPAPGARSYKLRWALGSGTDTGAFYGTDQQQSSGVYVVER